MTPLKVFFSGLELDPADLASRVYNGVIPTPWSRVRFACTTSVPIVNRWLTDHMDGRWAIFTYYNKTRYLTIAFELSWDCSMFMLSDGPRVLNTLKVDNF
jgi:hypothetical protein